MEEQSKQVTQEDVISIDLMELFYRLRMRWKLGLCLILVFLLAAGSYAFLLSTPMYEATSTIYVLSRRDSAINMADLQIGSALTKDYIKVFHMWEVHEQVISNLDLPYSYTQISEMLSVENETDTRMLDISITSPNPVEAAAIANEYAKVTSQYIAETMATDKPNIMSVALAPTEPVSPNKPVAVAVGGFLGFILYAGIVFIEMLMDDKYKSSEDIRQYTGLATLAIIPAAKQGGSDQEAENYRRKA